MRKSNFKILALTAALIMPLSSCKETIIYVTPEDTPNDDIKTPIELSVGGVDGAVESSSTRAVITDDIKKTYNPFDKDTKIFMVMKSTYGTEDYLGSHKDKYTVSRGEVKANTNTITFDALNQKYWDDAHARSSQLDIWAYASMVPSTWNTCSFQVPDPNWTALSTETLEHKMLEYIKKDYETNTQAADKSPYPWTEHTIGTDKGSKGAIYPCIMVWKVTNETTWKQTTNSVQYQDLMFSNNLTKHGDNPEIDNRLKFNFSTRKFDGGEMKFYHAMSKITINIIEGDGFDKTSDDKDFQFATNTNVKLNGFNTQGTFNIKNGYFEKVDNHEEITSIALTSPKGTNPNPYYTLQALAIPNINGTNGLTDEYSRFLSTGTNTMMEFTIDNNTYKITSKQLYDALHGKTGTTETTTGIIPLEAGKNYIFTFVVGKTKIDKITATVANWEDVVAESFVPVIDVTQEYGDATLGTAFDKIYTLLSSDNKAGSYKNEMSATMTYNTIDNKYSMSKTLYWPDHKTHYFFRGVYPNIDTSTGHPTLDDTGKLINVSNCPYTKETSPSDLMIGIPWKNNTFDETCNVTGHTGDRGICATEGKINLNFRYAMSQVEVKLTTGTDESDKSKVNIANAKVEVINGCNAGTIKLEDGSVGSRTTGNFNIAITTANSETKGNSSVIPQSLKNVENNLRFKITIYKEGSTTEEIDDIYYADIKDIKVKVGTADPATITSWEAGKHYIYTLDLRKTEIKVSATITDWVTATGSTNVWF